jgi:hypothetical protein
MLTAKYYIQLVNFIRRAIPKVWSETPGGGTTSLLRERHYINCGTGGVILRHL